MIHANAEIHPTVEIDHDTVIVWEFTKIRERARIGTGVKIGRCVYIDHHVEIGNLCKIQNGAQIYYPCVIGDGVFIGPNAQIINDRMPRACNPAGGLAMESDWLDDIEGVVRIGKGASIGSGAIIFPGVTIGEGAMVGANAVVRCDIPDGETFTG